MKSFYDNWDKEYKDYLQNNLTELMILLTEQEEIEKIRFLIKEKIVSNEAFTAAIECAVEAGKTEILSILMDEKTKAFPKKKKTFDL